jgi:pimeloyl-ACP methyl ester carboxylesterase
MSVKGQKETFRDRATCAAGKAFNRDEVFDLYFTFIPLLDFPSGIPMHLSAHQPQHQLAACERLNLRCDHESHSQNRANMTPERKVVQSMNTIPGMPCINHDQYDIDGIRVERFTTAPKDAAQRPPLICVHGGCHASWSWQEHAPVYAAAGYEVHALNWRGRGGSAAINDESFVKLSIADVVDDIDKVARCFDTPPVLIAHSMGGLAAQLYASAHEVGALVLLTPVVPSNVGATPHELPIGDMDAPWGPPPPDVARQMFFQGLDDMQAAHFYALLVPESPLRVYEATRWSLAVDATKLTAPILIVSGALDILTPPETGAALAALYGATYQLGPAHGHNVLLGEGARRIAEDVIAWVVGRLAR